MERRTFLQLGLGSAALSLMACGDKQNPEDSWWAGDIQHILPLVSERAFNIKVSFADARGNAPSLTVNGEVHKGQQQDSDGRFFAFRLDGLLADTSYSLQLVDETRKALCDEWPLSTFPSANSNPEQLSIAAYTCSGGPDWPTFGGKHGFKPAAYRARLYDIILDQQPDLVVANGDHIYWDYRSWKENPDTALLRWAMTAVINSYGRFDETQPVMGTDNEKTLIAIGDDQIASSYGVRFRSTPVLFITDDHDYFDNDDASPELVTFPPDQFHQDLRNTLQSLYFPEFIVDGSMPETVPGQKQASGVQLSTLYGQVNYGKLFSGLLYDCGGMLDLNGENAGLIPPAVESWLMTQTAHETTQHMIHFPSHPMGWTAGKWREWYPDLLESSGSLVASVEHSKSGGKYLWQKGWWNQHQRLLQALSSQKKRKPLMVSGDLHLLGAGAITQSGDLDFQDNPVYSILSGPGGVGDLGWLSSARGLQAQVPLELSVDEMLPPVERNGYTKLVLTPNGCEISLYAAETASPKADLLQLELVKKFTV
jgi:hypothetical protein